MKYNKLSKDWQKAAKQIAINQLNEIEREAETGYINNEENEVNQIAINEILEENDYDIEYNNFYPEGILRIL